MLKTLLYQFRFFLTGALILSVLSAAVSIFTLKIITSVIDQMSRGQLELQYQFSTFIAAVALVMAFGFLSQYMMLKLSTGVVLEVQTTLLKRILATSYEQIERIGSHRVVASMDSDVTNVSEGLMILPMFVFNGITVLCCMGYLLYHSWQLTLLVSILFGLIYGGTKLVSKINITYEKILREYRDEFFQHLDALGQGGKEIQLNQSRRRHFYQVCMIPLFKNIRKVSIKSEVVIMGLSTYSNMLLFLLIGSLVYGAHTFFGGLESQVVITFVLVIMYMVDPLLSVVSIVDEVNKVQVSLSKIENLGLADSSRFSLPPVNTEVKPKIRSLISESLCYAYPEPITEKGTPRSGDLIRNNRNIFTLGPISAKFNAGEITYLAGDNGSGKSTFAKVLLGLYPLSSGSIRLDDVIINTQSDLADYQRNVSAIFADAYVFDNLLSRDGHAANDHRVRELIERLGLKPVVSYDDGVLSSTELSQGQCRRLAILSSLVQDTQICVYDELASDLDPSFKRYVYTELLPELKSQGKIIIVISHDDHYFEHADQIIFFENGKIINRKTQPDHIV